MTRVDAVRRLAACAAVVLVATAGAALADSSARRDAAGADQALDRALRTLTTMRGGPRGAIAIVQRGNDLSVHRAGVSDVATGQLLTVNKHMRVASVAKAFSGAAALSLVDEGVLTLDDTVGQHLPELPAAWAGVTLRQLLNHTSGVPDFSLSKRFLRDVLASLTDAPAPGKLLSYVANKPLDFPSGTKYVYSNSENIVVALMVRAASERSYVSVLQTDVFGPLNLSETSLPHGAELPEPFIHGYDNDPQQDPRDDVSEALAAGWTWASGGVVSTPAELNKFIRGYVGAKLFDKRVRAEQRKTVNGHSEPPGPGTNSAGLAIFRYETNCGTMWGHTGNTPGYTQFAAASPDGTLSVVVSINAQNTLDQGAPPVFQALLAAEELAVCAAFAR